MRNLLIPLTLGLAFAHAAAAYAVSPVEPKVIFVVIDGIRDLELQGKAKDDQGKPVAASALFPSLLALKSKGVFFPEMHISNPAGISLPAYSDLFAGRRQEKIVSNSPPKEDLHSHYPTIFQAVHAGLKLAEDAVAVIASWKPICNVSATLPESAPENGFFRSCGWKKEGSFKPETFPGSRTDMDTWVEAMQYLPAHHPRLAFVHLGDADEEGHFQRFVLDKTKLSYGIFHYHQALREDDYFVGRLWKAIQEDPFYKDQTYLIVTTDHGRDNLPVADQWADHGQCVKFGDKKLCSGCQHVFGLILGPGIRGGRVVTANYTHLDFAPTIARWMGVDFPSAVGKPIREVLPK